MHRTLMNAFPDGLSSNGAARSEAGLLYRVEATADGAIVLLVQSALPPAWTHLPPSWLQPAFKELLPRAFQFSQLRSRFFFDGHQFVASLLSLPSELRFESFLALGVALFPNRRVVFDLLLHHRVEDDRDLVGGRCGGLRGVHFALHPAEIVPQLRLVVMQRICRQSE